VPFPKINFTNAHHQGHFYVSLGPWHFQNFTKNSHFVQLLAKIWFSDVSNKICLHSEVRCCLSAGPLVHYKSLRRIWLIGFLNVYNQLFRVVSVNISTRAGGAG